MSAGKGSNVLFKLFFDVLFCLSTLFTAASQKFLVCASCSDVGEGTGFIDSRVLLLGNEDSVEEMEAGSNSLCLCLYYSRLNFWLVFLSLRTFLRGSLF